MAQQSSRLHRLLTLLDTGSTQATRFTAARQLGEIAKSHPQDLTSLLKKVSQYLRSKNWDTRVAAAHAIGAIAQNVKHTSVSELIDCVGLKISEAGLSGTIEDVLAMPDLQSAFKSFDMNNVLEFGALVASGGQEFDVTSENIKSPKERLARQKQNLRRRLGLDVCEQFMDVSDMIRDEDLILDKVNMHGNGGDRQMYPSNSIHNIQQFVANMAPYIVSKRPSARERNLLKRKAKINSKDQTKHWSEEGETDVAGTQLVETPRGSGPDLLSSQKAAVSVNNDDDFGDHDGDGQWPFHNFVEQLLLDMFDSNWEVRHGSVMALREILTHQGGCAGVPLPDLVVDSSPLTTLEDGSMPNKLKRERDIDLNMQLTEDEFEFKLKRPKFEDALCPPANLMVCAHEDIKLGISVKVENDDRPLPDDQSEAQFNVCSVKVEDHPNGSYYLHKDTSEAAAEECPDNKLPSEGTTMLTNFSENHELRNLVKLTRHSWLKNFEFLQDCAIRLLCILLLDRFGDYVSDQVVAPVRETCAQALGAVFKYMHPSLVNETLNILLQMQFRQEWEVRHGSLLGIKYLVAVRKELLHDLLSRILPACKAGLEDPDDDVQAVAADALIPAASSIVSLKGQTLHLIVMLLWDILLDLDDLSPSTSSVMNLLAEIYSQKEMIPKMFEALTLRETQEFDLNGAIHVHDPPEGIRSQENPYAFASLAPRLWPFMRHSITSVRYSAIRTLERLLEAGLKQIISVPSTSIWPTTILGDTLRIVFQNLLLESNDDILECSERVWRLLLQSQVKELELVARSYVSSWLELATTSYGSAFDSSKLFWPVALPRRSHFRAAAKMRAVKLENESSSGVGMELAKVTISHERNGDSSSSFSKIIVGADADISVTHTRVVTATALGIFASKLNEGSLQDVIGPLWNAFKSSSGVQRQVASIVLISWFKEIRNQEKNSLDHGVISWLPNYLRERLLDLLTCSDPAFPTKDSLLPYSELSRTYSKMRGEATQLVRAIESSGMLKEFFSGNQIDLENLTADEAINFASKIPTPLGDIDGNGLEGRQGIDDIESLKQRLLTTSGYLKCVQGNLHISVSAMVAAAVVWMSELPTRLNPIILPLMASIKREQEEILQQKAADALAELICQCVLRKPGPNDKLIKNICTLTCMDASETPQAAVICSMEVIDEQDILSSGTSTRKSRTKVHTLSGTDDRSRIEGFISRRGSELVLRCLCEKLGDALFGKLPKLWDCLTEILLPTTTENVTAEDEQKIMHTIESVKDPQTLINNIQVVRSIAPMLNEKLKPRLLTLLPCIFGCIRHSHVAVRLAASRCITSMAKSLTIDVMGAVIQNAIPMLEDMNSVNSRQGAGMLISLLVQGMGVELVSYAPLLVVPLLRCMSDCDQSVRRSVTHSFAALVPLLPLARGLPPPVGLSEAFSKNKEDAQFLEQLLDNSHIEDYKLCTELKMTLRRYQQEGINWLAFLKRFKLHGILCDDMGLGKTLQASAIVACDIVERLTLNNKEDIPPSLIICPSTLVGHWAFEIEKYVDVSILSTLQYVGSVQERASLRDCFNKYNVIITSYDVVRKDVEYLSQFHWNYCILDEGHIIRNAKSKITLAVKQLRSQNRLVLSGTPIQNNVMDLWSLFDFLMPGFLGTERQFQSTYGKPLLAARDSKCSARDAEAGALAMEALHKQVMPFLLRRTKDEVLSDLPEKIIQDRYCDLSPVQLKLYERFSGSHVRQEISSIVKSNESDVPQESSVSTKASSHIFQALQYLLKLCSHPLLVTGEKMTDSMKCLLTELIPDCSDLVSELHKLYHSPKLVALREILEECGIGVDTLSSDGAGSFGQHRVLIFAQHKALLDIIERDLFHAHMKNVTYLRLDGSVEPEKRFDIVKAFNSDPTIDALLLTTHVGGLGLNLTSADTLVFMEHDWNPMRDHQAMDRAHRLGQRKVVNVHRLIMRGTVEEKVMSLQKFKVSVANAVINSENASMKTMNTDQLLDLFTSAETSRKGATSTSSKQSDENFDGEVKAMGGKKGLKAILGGLEELWDQSQYTEEYSLSQFLAKLNG
ncbi:TATA-binding protein-associated factor BTAF1 [Cucurbita pepo subsp. pepo]|uniref:TATA-binding protein-associated factor BTAF1 n=1 Tax=Cucurbita pepo subsp. pepo TaxID=3664 RepID=UPI000C9D972D|nr:TATA-binding protein-associated factor BTAF1 [Cucurbita pepo subsp. pepo]